jgi:type IX secretion system PorP/SprF family membrane protein
MALLIYVDNMKNKNLDFMKKIITIFLIYFLQLNFFSAQQESLLSQYMYSNLIYNPAFSGTKTNAEISGIFRKQWVNFDGAPVTEFLSAEGPIHNKNMGWGVILSNDKIGVSCRTDINLNYSYHIKINETYRLALGVRGGVNYCRAQLSDLKVWDNNDAVFNVNQKNFWLPNAGAGLFFYGKNFYTGFSCPNLIDYSNTNFSTAEAHRPKLVPHYYFTTGVNINTDRDIIFRPSMLVKYVPFVPVQADLSLLVDLKNRLTVGFSYRTGDGIIGMLQIQFLDRWRMGYAYDYQLTRVNQFSYGTHELMLTYKLNNLEKKMPSF